MDIVGPFPRSVGGYQYLFVAIDKFTKWPEVEPVRVITAQAAIKFIRGIVCRFGVPNRIITDNGTQFTSGAFTDNGTQFTSDNAMLRFGGASSQQWPSRACQC